MEVERSKTWKLCKNGGTTGEYLKAKKGARTVLYFVKKDAHTKRSASISNNKGKNHQNKTMLMLLVKHLLQMMMES